MVAEVKRDQDEGGVETSGEGSTFSVAPGFQPGLRTYPGIEVWLYTRAAAWPGMASDAQLREDDSWALVLAATSYKALGRHDECKSAARRALERIEREIALRLDNAHVLVSGCNALAYLGPI